MTEDMLMHRIRAHRSAPDVYDPPTFEDMARRIEEYHVRCETLEELVMDVVADCREGLRGYEIEERIRKVMQKLEWNEDD